MYFLGADICASATSVLCNSGREGGEEYVQCAARLSRMSSKPTDLNKLSNGCSLQSRNRLQASILDLFKISIAR